METDMRYIQFANGTKKELPTKLSFEQLKTEADIQFAEPVRRVLDGKHVMLVEEDGHAMGLPRNDEATKIYDRRCGFVTGHTIVGNVVIIPNSDRLI